MIKRAVIIVLDSFGVGEAPDAAEYGDVGRLQESDTERFGARFHIYISR